MLISYASVACCALGQSSACWAHCQRAGSEMDELTLELIPQVGYEVASRAVPLAFWWKEGAGEFPAQQRRRCHARVPEVWLWPCGLSQRRLSAVPLPCFSARGESGSHTPHLTAHTSGGWWIPTLCCSEVRQITLEFYGIHKIYVIGMWIMNRPFKDLKICPFAKKHSLFDFRKTMTEYIAWCC